MYKLSRYNYFTEFEDKVLYCNGLSAVLFAMSKNEHEKIQELFTDLISFRIKYDSVFKKFKDWGFILESDIEEIDIIRLRNKKAIFEDKYYCLIINPTLDCVFNCWYCDQHTQNHGGMNDDVKDRILKHLDYMIRGKRITGLFLDWFGGEPLMYFDEVVYPIAKYANTLLDEYNLPLTHHITTNAYLLNEDIAKKMAEIRLKSFQITLDGDEKRHNKIRNVNGKPSFKKIMESIRLIFEYIPGSVITLRLNYDDTTLVNSNMISVYEQIPEQYRNRINISLIRVWQTVKENPKENKPLKDLIEKIIEMGFRCSDSNTFELGRTHVCYTDRLYHTVVNYDGKVYRCTANSDREKESGILHGDGIIEWNEQELSRYYGKAKFENEECLGCRYLPICLKGCIMYDGPCDLPKTETSPDEFIINTYLKKVKANEKTIKNN